MELMKEEVSKGDIATLGVEVNHRITEEALRGNPVFDGVGVNEFGGGGGISCSIALAEATAQEVTGYLFF